MVGLLLIVVFVFVVVVVAHPFAFVGAKEQECSLVLLQLFGRRFFPSLVIAAAATIIGTTGSPPFSFVLLFLFLSRFLAINATD